MHRKDLAHRPGSGFRLTSHVIRRTAAGAHTLPS